MPSLSAILDANLKRIDEPGFGKDIDARALGTHGAAKADNTSPAFLWKPPLAHTAMLRPLQLNADWLNSTNALTWIIRLADMDCHATDLANGFIFEDAAFGNTANPWIYHIATIPSGFFPAMPGPGEFPTSDPSLIGIDPGLGPGIPSLLASPVRPVAGYALPPTVPAKGAEPAPVQTVDHTTSRVIGQSKQPLVANQPLLLRWVHSASQLGFPPVYWFYIGQYCLAMMESVCQVFVDDSAHGNRNHWSHVTTLPLWTGADDDQDEVGIGTIFQAIMSPVDFFTHERSLLWIPMRRNQVLLIASPGGKAKLLQTRPSPQRLTDDSDWDIVRSDKLIVEVLTPIWGRFQVQRVAYPTGNVVVDTPTILLDYTPATAPDHTIAADTDHGTTITAVRSSPPSYTLPVNSARECPNVPASIPAYQARQYGYELTFNSGSGGVAAPWTPFFYNLRIHKEPALVASTATPKTVTDTTAGSPGANQSTVVELRCSLGRKPGEGRAEVNVWDHSNYPLASYYYRCGYPIQVKNGTDVVFTGYTMNQGVRPLKVSPAARQVTITCADRWYQVTNTYLRDQRNWAGVGHIDVVQTILQQCGVDITGMDTPPKTTQYNQILGSADSESNAAELEGSYLSPWKPKPAESAASFLQRIAEHFSGWDLGFDASGVPFYLPKYYYTTPEVRFYETAAAATADGHTGSPLYHEATFSMIEPEANVIFVKAINRTSGQPFYSSVWIDWASILNPNVVNYVGRRKVEVIEIAGRYSCAGINWAARIIWNQTRRRHVIARFECAWNSAVKVGHCLALHPYGNYRVISYSCRFHKPTHQRMEIEAEFIEKGYGLP